MRVKVLWWSKIKSKQGGHTEAGTRKRERERRRASGLFFSFSFFFFFFFFFLLYVDARRRPNCDTQIALSTVADLQVWLVWWVVPNSSGLWMSSTCFKTHESPVAEAPGPRGQPALLVQNETFRFLFLSLFWRGERRRRK